MRKKKKHSTNYKIIRQTIEEEKKRDGKLIRKRRRDNGDK
jgi:hypothetical protein